MKGSTLCLLAGALLAVLIVAAAQWVGKSWGAEAGQAVYLGGGAGWMVGAAGVPFVARLEKILGRPDGAIWLWWGLGFGVRLVLVLLSSAALIWNYDGPARMAAILALMTVYLTALFAEAGWLAAKFAKTDNCGKPKE